MSEKKVNFDPEDIRAMGERVGKLAKESREGLRCSKCNNLSINEDKYCMVCGEKNAHYSEQEFTRLAKKANRDPGFADRECANGHPGYKATNREDPETALQAPYCERCGKYVLDES